MLTDFQILQHGPGQEDASWPYEAQLFFGRSIETEARRDALEEAAQLVERATYRKRWAKAAANGQASNIPPCELAAAIRARIGTSQSAGPEVREPFAEQPHAGDRNVDHPV